MKWSWEAACLEYIYLFLLGEWLNLKQFNNKNNPISMYLKVVETFIFSKKTSSCVYKILDLYLETCFQMTTI